METFYIVWFLTLLVIGFIGKGMAEKRGRSGGAGFAMGFLLGLVGLAVIGLLGEVSR